VNKRVIVSSLLVTTFLFAQGGTPMITDDTGTPKANGWEINLATTFEARDKNRVFEAPLIDINYGLTDSIAIKAETSNSINKQDGQGSVSGLGGMKTGVKWRFYEQDGLSLSTYPRYTVVPLKKSIDRGVVENDSSIFLPLELTKEFDGNGFSIEAGYRFSKVSSKKDSIELGFVYGQEVVQHIELLCEYRNSSNTEFKGTIRIVQFGAKIGLHDSYYLVASVGKEITSPENKKALLGFFGIQAKF
jgi:hypothetical protein